MIVSWQPHTPNIRYELPLEVLLNRHYYKTGRRTYVVLFEAKRLNVTRS